MRLKPEDWQSGSINWLFDVIAPDRKTAGRVIANFRQVVKEGELRLHPQIGRLVEKEMLATMGASRLTGGPKAMGRSITFSTALTVLPLLSGVSAYGQTTTLSDEMAQARLACYGDVVEFGLTDKAGGAISLIVSAPAVPELTIPFGTPATERTPVFRKVPSDGCEAEPIPTKYFELFVGFHPSDIALSEAFYNDLAEHSNRKRSEVRLWITIILTVPEIESAYNDETLKFGYKEKMELRRKVEKIQRSLSDDGTFYSSGEVPQFLLSSGSMIEPVTRLPVLFECQGLSFWSGAKNPVRCSTNYLLESGVEIHYSYVYQMLPPTSVPILDEMIRDAVRKYTFVESVAK